MKSKFSKIIILLTIAALMVVFFAFDLGQYLTFDYLKSRQLALEAYHADHKLMTMAVYMAVYILVAALSLPGAAVMTLAGGAIFGLWLGLLLVSFASTIGATLAFLVARFLLKDYVQDKFGDRLKAINEGIEKDGAFYLFTLRLVPIFPFFVINLVMGLTPIRVGVFYVVSQIGMLAGTAVYVNAGTQLAKIDSLSGILSPGLIFSFVLLGIFPLIAKKIIAVIKAKKIMAKYTRPKKFDYNLVVIGAGAAGLVTSLIAATVRAKVALIEKHKMGGDCLNTGCVPSKSLIRSAKILSYVKRAKEFGFESGNIQFDFAKVMERVQKVIQKIEPHDSVERYSKLGVECISGDAKITSPYTVEVNGKTLTTKKIVVASGARPFVPPIPGLEKVTYLTSDNVWEIRELPQRLVVLGGGPIGCELTQTFCRLGSTVTQVEMMPQIMGREDTDVAGLIQEKLESEGVKVLTGHRAKEVKIEKDTKTLVCDYNGKDVYVEFDVILVAVGRAANISGFGLEELGVELTPRKTISANELLQTNVPTIYCAGDVVGPYQFTHVAGHQAWYASVNALFGGIKSFKVDYKAVPWATYTDPEVARVGLNEIDAKEKNIAYELTRYDIDDLDRAIADSEDHGYIKVLTKPGTDKILGVTIVGAHAGDIISEYVFAVKQGLGLNKILGTIHIYPTMAEANKYAAGEWKKAHAPEKILKWLGKYHAWTRG
ncbi:MAG: dihydrolipoyl dehydrogenase [Desulfobacteraceae bacterium]|nr:dihydrolipoyl dehydrogenase [Desulfobacteraceae bacterium]MBC2756876.1 dihydrolipoyl dehydrogenase [Desulfobacteraceae bacterium]